MSWNLNIETTCLDKLYTFDAETQMTIQREEYRDLIREIVELREKLKAEHKDFVAMYGENKELKEQIERLEGELEYWKDLDDESQTKIKELEHYLDPDYDPDTDPAQGGGINGNL